MAKYEDYVKNDQLDEEIEDAGAAAEERQDGATIPDRFKGKAPEDIAKSYTELEKLYSKQAQDLGRMRKTVDELIELKLPSEVHGAEPSKKPLSTDEMLENPDESIRRVVKEESADRIAQLERELQQERINKALDKLTESFPTWKTDVQSPEMINWIQEKPYRVRLARQADAGDMDAAADLFGSYYDTQKPKEDKEKRQEKKRKVLDASLETGGATVPEVVESYSRSALMEKRIAAKRGDSAAQRYLDAHASKIQQAYTEGRVVD